MKYCSKCGAQCADEVKFCSSCGNTFDATQASDKQDAEQNKAMAILSYLGILVLIPILAAKDSKFARFHANQGLVLCIAAIAYGVATSVLTAILIAISWRLAFISTIFSFASILFFVLCIIGIINAANGQEKELPVIGKFRILK